MVRLILIAFLLIIEPAATFNGSAAAKLAIDDPAPAFALKDLNGVTVRLADYKGKVLLINFWATWCVPCRAEMPELAKLEKEHEARGLRIVGITHPPVNRQSVEQVAQQLKLNYPILLGSREISAAYGVSEILPVTIVVDREGKIRARILGILVPEEFDYSVKPLLENESR